MTPCTVACQAPPCPWDFPGKNTGVGLPYIYICICICICICIICQMVISDGKKNKANGLPFYK